LDTKDWKYRNADTVARTILNSITAGDIILLHDIYPSTLQAVKKVLPLLKEHGYEFVTVSELLGEEMQPGKKYSNAY
jgi:peptidoglycan/xylan/chitin deacetylase (PgdA/CDA1 family)